MRFILLFIIKCYWAFVPAARRRKCLFKVSCSRKVYKVARDDGLIAGLKILAQRYRQCRPGYIFHNENGPDKIVRLADGTRLNIREMRPIE